LKKERVTDQQIWAIRLIGLIRHTKAVRRIAGASAALPNIVLGGTMGVRRMFIPNFAEEVDAIRAREERCCD